MWRTRPPLSAPLMPRHHGRSDPAIAIPARSAPRIGPRVEMEGPTPPSPPPLSSLGSPLSPGSLAARSAPTNRPPAANHPPSPRFALAAAPRSPAAPPSPTSSPPRGSASPTSQASQMGTVADVRLHRWSGRSSPMQCWLWSLSLKSTTKIGDY